MQGSLSFQQRLNASAEEMSGEDYDGHLYLKIINNKGKFRNERSIYKYILRWRPVFDYI